MLTATKTALSTAHVSAVLPVVDIDRAMKFYGEVLGLEVTPLTGMPGYFTAAAGSGTAILLYKREATKAEHTVAVFRVSDISSVVSELRSHGVVFEEYDLPGLKTVGGIAEAGPSKAAWFKDSEGNTISVTEM